MRFVLLIVAIALSVRFVHKLSALLWLWWRKEYRLDRMAIHLKTKQGKALFTSKSDWMFACLLLLYFLPGLQTVALIGIAVASLAVSARYLSRSSSWYIPPFSPKVLAVFAVFAGCIGFFVYRGAPLVAVLVLFDVLMFPLSIPLVFLLGAPTKLYHAYIISGAVKKLRAHAPMTVIGITGSYGKTSVKDYLSSILSTKYKTLKTAYSKNSPIGIAEVIRDQLQAAMEVFVVEMGAYKPGEIATMAAMVRPEIGIVTAVNPQHQDLFGTIETTAKAKYELLEGLTGKRTAIVNWDNPHTRNMGYKAKKAGMTVYWWTTKETKKYDHMYYADHIRPTLTDITFDVRYGKERISVHAPVVGAHQAGNLLAAIIAAHVAGMSLVEAGAAASKVEPAEKVMQVERGMNGSMFINDTFNNNPDAARAAISFLSQNKGKKYLVFQPMIELGSFAESAHEEVGEFAAGVCDAIILTNANYFESFKRGVEKKGTHTPLMVMGAQSAAEFLKKKVTHGDMVLFKGKDAEHTLAMLRSDIR